MQETDVRLTVGFDVKDAEKSAKELQKIVKDIVDERSLEEQSAQMTQQMAQMKKTAMAAQELADNLEKTRKEADHVSEGLDFKSELEMLNDYVTTLTTTLTNMKEQLEYTKIIQFPDMEEKMSLKQLEDIIKENQELERNNELREEGIQDLREMEALYKTYHDEAFKNTVFELDYKDAEGELHHMKGTYHDYLNILQEGLAVQKAAKEQFEQQGYSWDVTTDTLDKLNVKADEYLKKLELMNDRTTQQIVKYEELSHKADDAEGKSEATEFKHGISSATRSVMGLNMAIRGVGRLIPNVSTTATTAIASASRGILRLASLTKKDLVNALNSLKAVLLKILSNPVLVAVIALIGVLAYKLIKLKNALDALKNVLSKVGEMAVALLKSIPKQLSRLVKNVLSLGTFIERFFISGLVKLIKKLISLKSVISESLNYMALWNDGANDVNKSMTNLTSSLAYLKASVATAFAPILTTVEPLLTSLADKLAEVTTNIGIFIAQLTGQTYFQRAIKEQKDYAEALKGTNQQLASFDKLNVISDGSAEKDSPVKFEKVDIEALNLDVLDGLFEKAQKFAEKFTEAVNGIPWNSIQDGASKAAKAISDLVNGFTSEDGLGASLGTALGNLINTIRGFFDNLFDEENGIDFDKLGDQIKKFFENAFGTVDWNALGKTLWKSFKSALKTLRSILRNNKGSATAKAFSDFLAGALGSANLEWEEIDATLQTVVDTIVEFLNGIITPENFGLIGETLGNVMNSVVTAAKNFTDKVEWEQWGTAVGTAINTFFETWNLEFTGKAISNIATKLLIGLKSCIDEIRWKQIGAKIVGFLANIDWKSIADYAKEISGSLKDGLMDIWAEVKNSNAFEELLNAAVEIYNEYKTWENMFKQIKKEVWISALRAYFKSTDWGWIFLEGNTTTGAQMLKGYEIRQEEEKKKGKSLSGAGISQAKRAEAEQQRLEENTKSTANSSAETVDILSDSEEYLMRIWEELGSDQFKAITGVYFGGNIGSLTPSQIESLAKLLHQRGYANGTVIPASASEFLAKVGDNNKETEVISPLSTIEQALRNVMTEQNMQVTFKVEGDPNGIFKVVQKESVKYNQRTGSSAFA